VRWSNAPIHGQSGVRAKLARCSVDVARNGDGGSDGVQEPGPHSRAPIPGPLPGPLVPGPLLARLQEQLAEGSEALLPSEAQWEYACRAGTVTPFNLGEQISPEQVNYDGNHPYAGGAKGEYRQRTVAAVRSLPPNRWRLYEMHGNVCEWCADGLREYEELPAGAVLADPRGPTALASRALRGGAWLNDAKFVRSAARDAAPRGYRYGFIGFRLALRS